jgi:hypothetical protein
VITISILYLIFAFALVIFLSSFLSYWLGKDSASKELFHVKRRCRDAEAKLHLLTQRQQWLGD